MVPDFPDDENSDVLRQMYEDGDSLTQPRDIDFSVLFDTEAGARGFAAKMRLDDDAVEYFDEEEAWDVTVTRPTLPTHHGISAVEDELANASQPFGGRLDGWGCFNAQDREVG